MSGQLQLPIPISSAINPAAGEAAKNDGMAAAAASTDVSWADACDAAIREMARRGVEFQAADLIAEGLVDEPSHPNQWGPRLGAAARAGIIRAAGVAQSKRVTVHRSLCRTWVGVRPAEEAAA
jgi:hypothetical protein